MRRGKSAFGSALRIAAVLFVLPGIATVLLGLARLYLDTNEATVRMVLVLMAAFLVLCGISAARILLFTPAYEKERMAQYIAGSPSFVDAGLRYLRGRHLTLWLACGLMGILLAGDGIKSLLQATTISERLLGLLALVVPILGVGLIIWYELVQMATLRRAASLPLEERRAALLLLALRRGSEDEVAAWIARELMALGYEPQRPG